MSPVLIVPFGWIPLSGVLQRCAPPGSVAGVFLERASFGLNPSSFTSFVILVGVCYGACFEMWRRVERWRNPRGAVRRALLRMSVIIAINVASVFGIAWVAQFVANLLS